jgi:hypothetical protein
MVLGAANTYTHIEKSHTTERKRNNKEYSHAQHNFAQYNMANIA